MGRKPEGGHALTTAERQARIRARKASDLERYRAALERIEASTTIRDARSIAGEALRSKP
jgi:hypothetical protein